MGFDQQMYQRFADHPDAAAIMGLGNARALYRLVRDRKPKACVDLGTGIGTSAAVVASAMEENGIGEVYSLEHLKRLLPIAESLIPPEIRSRISLMYSPVCTRDYKGQEWVCYTKHPPCSNVDLVVIDGPPQNFVRTRRGDIISRPCGDILRLMPKMTSDAVVFVDGRHVTVKALRKALPQLQGKKMGGGVGYFILEAA